MFFKQLDTFEYLKNAISVNILFVYFIYRIFKTAVINMWVNVSGVFMVN